MTHLIIKLKMLGLCLEYSTLLIVLYVCSKIVVGILKSLNQ